MERHPFKLGRRLGTGGMGSVFEARLPDGQHVAVKVLHRTHLGSPHIVQRFREECLLGARIDDPHVVAVIGHGERDGVPYLIMEHVPGEPLDARLSREGRLTHLRAASVASQILSGLEALHEIGFVHGDVKSANVLLGEHDHVTLIDLDLARPALAPLGRVGANGAVETVTGTPAYMAPEIARGGAATPCADVFAAGVVLYEMITGGTPFGGRTTTEILDGLVADPVVPPSLRSTEYDVPASLERVVMRALAKDPADRYQTATEMRADLEEVLPELHDETVLQLSTRSDFETITVTWEPKRAPASRRRRSSARTRPGMRASGSMR